uniref:Retrotransposon gag domain-containing protein n=1 Tax=Fagus sylvatica TaxID=28930 RepID=A0A2N9HU73_FAGSY
MTGETSGPSAQDIRMASFEEKFNDLLNFVRLLVKRDTESEKQVEDIDKGTSEDNTGGHSHTNLGPPPVQPSKPEERDFQLDAKVEKTMRSTKMVDASALLALAKPDVENEARTVDPNVAPENDPSPKGNWNTLEGPQSLQMYGNGEENVMNKKEDDHSDIRMKESEKEAQSPISKKEEPKEVDHPMIPHKRYTPKNVVERVEQLEKRLDEVKDTEGKETLMLHTGRYQSSRNLSSSAKLKSELRKFCTLPMPMDELYPRLLEKRLISPVFLKQSPHLLHDSSKKCEFHFGRPGHSLEDCHALKNKVQDLVDHGILRINEGSTPSVIIAWPPERRKDETVIPSPQSQGPTTCGIQPVHLTTLPTLSEVGEHTVPKTQPKLMSNFRNLDDQCSSDKEKAEYRTNRCMTLKRKIQEAWSLGARCTFHGPS